MDNFIIEGLEPGSSYEIESKGSQWVILKQKPKEEQMEYEEVKTIFKEYVVHHRTVTICVKEFSRHHPRNNYGYPVHNQITIGISICNPEDEYNSQFGKQIAEGRADKALEKENQLMYIVGYLRDTPQSKNKFVLSQFAETAYYHFKHNPEDYIVNFNETIEDET